VEEPRRDAELLLGREIAEEEWETDHDLRLAAALRELAREGYLETRASCS